MVEFPEVKGKTLEALKLYLENDDTSLSLAFSDKTHLYLDLEPGLTVRADLSDWKTHNWRPIKSWAPFERASSWVDENRGRNLTADQKNRRDRRDRRDRA